MKKIIIFSIFMLAITNLFSQSQNNFCNVQPTTQFINSRINLKTSSTYVYDAVTPLVLNVRINVFNDLASPTNNFLGNSNYFTDHNLPFGEDECLEIVKTLNVNFNQFNIFFKYIGFSFINNSPLSLVQNSSYAQSFDAMVDLLPKDAININFVRTLQYTSPEDLPSTSSTATYSSLYGQANLGRPIMVLSMPFYGGASLIGDFDNLYQDFKVEKEDMVCHEMGHVLGLFHTFEDAGTPYCEHVLRTGPTYNALTSGDFIDDTQAQPPYSNIDYNENGTLGLAVTSGNTTPWYHNYDCENTPYYFNLLHYGNIMANRILYSQNVPPPNGYINPVNYVTRFTAGQGKFMRETLMNPSPWAGTIGHELTQSFNTVSSLFQPFKRIKIISQNILSSTDNGNGTAKVCRSYYEQFKFQKGFDYTFPENQSPDLNSYTIDDIPFISAPPFNCPIGIAQLAPGLTNLTTNFGQAETVCRGQVCSDEAFIKGVLISTEELIDMDYTIEQLNAIQVKDPELFNTLMSQRYYKLKKETASGAKTEEIFYKQ